MEPTTVVTPGPEQLRALAHPGRLRMLGLLRTSGPATATSLAGRLGLNTGATSYHLRQLAAHGFVVEDTERGNGRERWWRAAHQTTHTATAPDASEEERDVTDAYLQAVAITHADNLQRALAESRALPEAWQQVLDLSDWNPRLTAAHAKELSEAIHELVSGWPEDVDDPEAQRFVVNVNTYLRPGTLR
ncbi:ArsR family transcriptional regulator [Nocardioides mangrovicus]|uniref:ArsR family transcriptional regulator n=1 Tax=Nocardioides mangrovicus TaxID=2478913 RepID=A0A3L8NZE7_9ACTN|nr:winged helix-turn-helix domain-containing protein [Nocardioides mangrovicus]RLV47923.1 ArsR family transcriptional regulator [Nocardioides mangrovicus]